MGQLIQGLLPEFFMFANPILWLFLLHPAILFWVRRDQERIGDLLLTGVLSVLLGWMLAIAYVFGTDWFVWWLAETRESIPRAWEQYLYGDGGRDVFVLILGWAYGLVVLALWVPLMAIVLVLRRRTNNRGGTTASPAA